MQCISRSSDLGALVNFVNIVDTSGLQCEYNNIYRGQHCQGCCHWLPCHGGKGPNKPKS